MSTELWVNDAGVARQITEIWVNDNGTARQIRELWTNDSGTARRIYADGMVDIITATYSVTGFGLAFYEVRSTGVLSTSSGNSNWITPQVGMSKYEIRATTNSQVGAGTFSGTVNAWLALTSNRSWSANRPSSAGAGTDTWQLSIQIRRASDAVVVDTATITLNSSN